MMAEFRMDPHFQAAAFRSTGMKTKLQELADAGAKAYAESVPVETEELKNSIFGDVALTETGYKGRIGATSPHAALVELGTREHAPDGSLRRALEALGVPFEIVTRNE
jgi:hypothetical protein